MSVLSRARWASTTILVLAATTLPVGVPPASAADVSTTFDRPHAITFNDGPFGVAGGAITVPASGTATPYPSQIVVDEPGLVLDLDVTVEFAHDSPDDLDVLLVGPRGQSVVLMSDAGGTAPTDAEPTFDDEADGALPDDEPIEFLNGELQTERLRRRPGRVPRTGSIATGIRAARGVRRHDGSRHLEPVRRRRQRHGCRPGHRLGADTRPRRARDLPVRAAGLRHRAGHRR